jgi:hypothetical protein
MEVKKIINLCGGATYLSTQLGVASGAITAWMYRERIPMKHLNRLKKDYPHIITDDVFNRLIEKRDAS